MKVLVAGFDGRLMTDVCGCFEDAGLDVVRAQGSRDAIECCELGDFAVIAIVAAGGNGEHVKLCRQVIRRAPIPVLVIGSEREYEVSALEAGADDYLLWPLDPRLLEAKIEALQRRFRRNGLTRVIAGRGLFALDLLRPSVTVQGREVTLTPAEFRLLRCLMCSGGKVVSHKSLVAEVYGYDCGTREAQQLIKALVRRLRRKIEPDPHRPKYVRSVRGFGYMLQAQLDIGDRSGGDGKWCEVETEPGASTPFGVELQRV